MTFDVLLPLLLLGLGLLLVVLEVLLPAWGMIGVAAAVALLAGLWVAFQRSTGLGVAMMMAEALSIPVAVGGTYVVWARMGFGRRTMLEPPTAEEVDVCHSGKGLSELVGQVGRSVTQLGPSGFVEFDQGELEGVSVDGFVPAGMLVEAVSVRLGRVMVRRHAEAMTVE
jgi:membrane-bound serine protease (ClpP class)